MNRYSIFSLLLTLAVIILSISAIKPPPVVSTNAPDSVFSAQRAYTHLQQIAKAPHSMGTAEHARVREYIINTFRKLDLPVETQTTTVMRRYGSDILTAANVTNIIVTLKGKNPGKAIVIAAHYDSQPNTPGAGDDGIGVVSLLGVSRSLRYSSKLEHDVVFLLTDGEESGLFGAKGFIEENPSLKNAAIVINWDFRGNSGVVVTYETSDNNGWLMKEYAKSAPYPFASSMAYEVSKRMPNYSDFNEFKETGVSGFTSGLLGGFVNYHSMTDTPENLDLGSLQQTGSNALALLKRFGNDSLENTKAPDLSYFNLFGYWFITYPSSLNLLIVIAASLLFIASVVKGFRQRSIKPAGLVAGALILPVIMFVAYFACSYTLKLILSIYPLYSHFYENNSYNSQWYFLAITMIALLVFIIGYKPVYKKWGYISSYAGILLISTIFMWCTFLFIPSATYLVAIPCLFLSTGFLFYIPKKLSPDGLPHYSINFISLLPTILLFSPVCFLLFITFGLGESMPFVSILLVITAALLYPVLSFLLKIKSRLTLSICLAMLILSFLVAHVNSGYDKKHPLQTNVWYRLNADDSTAHWFSDFTVTDKFSEKIFQDKKIDTSFRRYNRLIHTAPVISYPAPTIAIQKDSTYGDTREVVLFCTAMRPDVNNMGINIDYTTVINKVSINSKEELNKNDQKLMPVKNIILYGMHNFLVRFEIKSSSKLDFYLYDRSMGLPAIKNVTEYPDDIIPGTDYNSNTTMVRTHFSL